MTDDYICHDPDCTESLAWHLINGDLDCIGDNREAIAAFAEAAQTPHVTVYLTSEGFEDAKVEVDLIASANVPHSTPDEGEVEPEPEPAHGGH
jgi:hypothetical protein